MVMVPDGAGGVRTNPQTVPSMRSRTRIPRHPPRRGGDERRCLTVLDVERAVRRNLLVIENILVINCPTCGERYLTAPTPQERPPGSAPGQRGHHRQQHRHLDPHGPDEMP